MAETPFLAFDEAQELAAAMDRRVAQLDADGVHGLAMFNQMAPFMLNLHRIYSSTSDQQLMALCADFPGFRKFAEIAEDAFEHERQKSSRPYDGSPELPEPLKRSLGALLTDAGSLETEYHAVAHAGNRAMRRDAAARLKAQFRHWCAARDAFLRDVRALPPSQAGEMVRVGLEDITKRIDALQKMAGG